ncbi:uncharacterized protein [Typha latifolia]|uniref:uncharacterized protein n=1 Tax=Typha latifolia TaxID=4733 RepID=UPI003C2ADA39
MAISMPSSTATLDRWMRLSPWSGSTPSSPPAWVSVLRKEKKRKEPSLAAANCIQSQQNPVILQGQEEEEEEAGIMCEPCKGRGWLLCDFCEGKKTYVKAENNRVYRRCPTCKAVGYVLCSNCKVFKCITFPDYSDGEL